MDITIERVIELFENHNKSFKAILLDMGFSPSTFNDWKRGQSKPTAEALKKLSSYFNVSADYLLGLTDIKQPFTENNIMSINIFKTLADKNISLSDIEGISEDKQQLIVDLIENFLKMQEN